MTEKEIIQALREECKTCSESPICENGTNLAGLYCANKDAANLIERLTAENAALCKEIEWKDMVIALAQRKQAEAEAERDALREKVPRWISVDDRHPKHGTRVLATDGVFVGEAIYALDGRWSGYGGGILRDCLGSVITHWMPLPETPEVDL